MPVITLHVQLHRGERRYFLHFGSTREINPLIKRISGSRWSRTRQSWHLPFSKTTIQDLRKILPKEWEIQHSDSPPPALENPIHLPARPKQEKLPVTNKRKSNFDRISNDNRKILEAYVEQLKLKAYSANTIRTYQNEFTELMALIGKRRVD
ncbi:MAG TPA: hypothetical protein PKK69_03520, partial [Ferruginibacter sp.]|nr:hypothetical protein [Ferruginibacter sp.]